MSQAALASALTSEQEIYLELGLLSLSVIADQGFYRCENESGTVGVGYSPRQAIEKCWATEVASRSM